MKPSDLIKHYGVKSRDYVKCWGHSGSAYTTIRRAMEGRVSVETLERMAKCLGVSLRVLMQDLYDIYGADIKTREKEDIAILKSMARKNPDIAYAYYLELRARGHNTPAIDELIDELLEWSDSE